MPANSLQEILDTKTFLLRKYTPRNEMYHKFRRFYNAEFWTGKENNGIRLIYNLLASAVDRYTDFMVQTPDWQVIPADTTPEAMDMADLQEKLLYSQYARNNIQIIQPWMAHLQSLLGMFCITARPNFLTPDQKTRGVRHEKYVKLDVAIPDCVLPFPKSDNVMDLDCLIILSDTYQRSDGERFQPTAHPNQRIAQMNTCTYYDDKKIVIIRDNKIEMTIEHNLGFVPAVVGQNRIKPHFVEGTSDIEQAAGLNEYLNDLLSWEADIIQYSADPITVISGYSGETSRLERGPGARWGLPPGADAKFLTWNGNAPDVDRMLSRVQGAIEDLTVNGDVLFARNVPSGTSGSAVRSLMSGIQAAFLRKQVTLGTGYVQLNEMIFRMLESFFPEQELLVRGTKKGNVFVNKMKGKEIAGNYMTNCIWPPGVLDQPSRIDIELRKMEARIQSKRTTMENCGILSPKDELTMIEQEEEAALEREILKQNGGDATGLPSTRRDEFKSVASQLESAGAPNGGPGGAEQRLMEIIQGIPKIRGSVFYGGKSGDGYVLVLTELNDKATINNRVPSPFKGKLRYRKFDEEKDDELLPIVENEQAAPVPPAPEGE